MSRVCADLLWLQRRCRRLKPPFRNLMNEAVSKHDSLLFFQACEDDLDLCIEVGWRIEGGIMYRR